MTLDATQGNALIMQRLSEPAPFMAARTGSIELGCIHAYMNSGVWSDQMKYEINMNTGFFPVSDEALKKFCVDFIKHLENVDVLAVWLYEDFLLKTCCNKAIPVKLRSLEPYYHQDPWSQVLKGKRVLVVHPYEDSIKAQYSKKELLFKDKRVLPDFDLDTIKAVQSIAGNKTPFKDWFEAFDSMCTQISNKTFDIAIVGAGAYGLPLASFIKGMGKKAIHIGGATQILFGIKGKRWDDHEDISKLFNDHWIRPASYETPINHIIIENGCYW
jgi:hypothetical protein